MWVFDVDGFFSVVEFSPPRKQIKKPVYATKEYVNQKGEVREYTDYQNIIEPAEYGTEFVLQEYIDQLGEAYTPATKEWLSSHLLVRARIEEDLKVLKNWDDKIIFFSDQHADYKYRAIMTRKGWAAYLYHMASTINYSSHVKEEMNKRAPQIPGGRYTAFSTIWNACMRWQDGSWGYGAYGVGGHYGSGSTGYNNTKSSQGTKYGKKGVHSGVPTWSGVVDKDDEWVDDPEPTNAGSAFYDIDLPEDIEDEPTDLEIQIASTGATYETMRAQLKDAMLEFGIYDNTFDLDNAVDQLVDSFGTCDLTTIKDEDLLDVVWVSDEKANV